MMLPVLKQAWEDLVLWLRCRTTHRHRVTIGLDIFHEHVDVDALVDWFGSIPAGTIYWYEQPIDLTLDRNGLIWNHRVMIHHWQFRRWEDAAMFKLRCPL